MVAAIYAVISSRTAHADGLIADLAIHHAARHFAANITLKYLLVTVAHFSDFILIIASTPVADFATIHTASVAHFFKPCQQSIWKHMFRPDFSPFVKFDPHI